ncbi:hypothetical protein [Mycobacterium tilburgii]|nr:hypothetical protein [Mycobacterium tilburgii]
MTATGQGRPRPSSTSRRPPAPPVHLLLGTDCVAAAEAKIEDLKADIEA